MRKTIFIILWVLLFTGILTAAFAFIAIKKGKIGYMPKIEELHSPINKYATQIISDDGMLLGTWSTHENRIYTDYDSISPYMFKALIATEDIRFYEHSGIDIRSLFRAIIKRGILRHESAGGGSTITQQLAKQLYSETAQSTMERLFQKPIEWVIATELERCYTKEEILTLYLNYFDFLHNAVGITTAAKVYFGKAPKNLNILESATLVGMCKNPSYFNPVRRPERCKERRNVVLSQMKKANYISEEMYDSLTKKPLKLRFKRINHKEGLATYMREYLRRILMAKEPERKNYFAWQKQQYYDDSLEWVNNPVYGWCNKNFKRDGSRYNIYTDGLKIFTSIDSRMQRYAEKSVKEHLAKNLQPLFYKTKHRSYKYPFSNDLSKTEIDAILKRAMKQSDRYRKMKADGANKNDIEKAFKTKTSMTVFSYNGDIDTIMTPLDSIKYYKSFLRSGFMALNPLNGHVKAYVGGPDYNFFQYDMCMSGRRQVGSTIKPYLYSLAMENGFSPCDKVMNVQKTYMVNNKAWTPRNGSRDRYGEMVTLKWGLAHSNNWISAYLMSLLNPEAFVRLLHDFGITNQEIVPSMSLCLGPCDISVAEMASAYSAFVNKGIVSRPLLVTRIEDGQGNVLATFQPRMNEVISEFSSYKIINMLEEVVNNGTGIRLRYKYKFTAEMGGKTGTTNDNSDGWFIGVLPRLVCSTWVGGENPDIHFDSIKYGQGATMALPIFAEFIKRVFNDSSLGYSQDEKFNIPEGFNPCPEETEDEIMDVHSGIDDIFE